MAGTLEQEILAQEERLTRATRELDLDALDGIYADDILFTGLTGATCGKSNLMDEARGSSTWRSDAARRSVRRFRHGGRYPGGSAGEGGCLEERAGRP